MTCKMLMIGTSRGGAGRRATATATARGGPGGVGKAPSDAVVLFDGKDVSNWTTLDGQPSRCQVSGGVMGLHQRRRPQLQPHEVRQRAKSIWSSRRL